MRKEIELLAIRKKADLQVAGQAGARLMAMGNRAIPGLMQALRDRERNEMARHTLSEIFAKGGGEPWVERLTAMLSEPDVELRRSGANLLAAVGKPSAPAVPRLIPLLKEVDVYVPIFAARALGRIGEPASPAIPHLIEALGGEDYFTVAAAALALGRIGKATPEVLGALSRKLGDPKAPRGEVVEALSELGEPAAPALIQALEHKVTRWSASRWLKKMAEKTADPGLRRRIQEALAKHE